MRDMIVFVCFLVISISCFRDGQIMAFMFKQRQSSWTNGKPSQYCDIDHRTAEVMKELRISKTKDELIVHHDRWGTRRRPRAATNKVSWPYDCVHASIIKYQGNYQFVAPIHTCCDKFCQFPSFSRCVSDHPTPRWLCPSDGLYCIVNCVKKHDPNSVKLRRIKTGTSRRVRLRPTIRRNPNKCERTVVRSGKLCTERLCFPLKL